MTAMASRWLASVACALGAAGCASFPDEDVIVDLRIIAMTSDHPEQVIDATPEDLENPVELLEQLVPTEMCALVADPARPATDDLPEIPERRLRWSMTLCVLNRDERCDSDVSKEIGSGLTSSDPDTGPRDPARPRGEMCATIQPDGNLLAIVMEAFEGDSISGLGGIDYGVSLRVGPEGEPPEDDQYAGKTLRVSPRIPAERSANTNPNLERFDASIEEDGSNPTPLLLGRCVDQPAPLEVAPDTRLRIEPIETPVTRETYTVPTLDGMTRTFTESPTYQWLASGGSFSSGSTGGTRDVAGNLPELHTFWRAPDAEEVVEPQLFSLWIVQRDERLGAVWYEACVRVVP